MILPRLQAIQDGLRLDVREDAVARRFFATRYAKLCRRAEIHL